MVVTCCGQEFTIPALPASDWIQVIWKPNLLGDDFFPGLLPEPDRLEVERLLHQGQVDWVDVNEAGFEVLTQAAGREFWVALRLCYIAKANWDALASEMAGHDSTVMPLGAWLDVLYRNILLAMEESKRQMFLLKLELPPPGWGDESDQEMSVDAFMAMAG
jgi:hypothetical protein